MKNSILSKCFEKPFLIAEIGQAHDGSLGMAHSFIDLAAELKLDGIKFQVHLAEAESTQDERFRTNFSYEDATRYDYWRRMEFNQEQWAGLRGHAKKRDIAFGTSCFSSAAVELIRPLEVDYWKIGSGEIFSSEMLSFIGSLSETVLLSSGLATELELSNAVDVVKRGGAEVGLFQCTSKYPTNMSEVGLNLIEELKIKYNCPVGLSDHSGVIWPSVAAMAIGAQLIEFHLAFHKSQFGPDTTSSLVPEQVLGLVEARDAISVMLACPLDREFLRCDQKEMRALFGKSLCLVRPMKAGQVISQSDLTLKKPAGGISVSEMSKVIGQTLSANKSASRLLKWGDML